MRLNPVLEGVIPSCGFTLSVLLNSGSRVTAYIGYKFGSKIQLSLSPHTNTASVIDFCKDMEIDLLSDGDGFYYQSKDFKRVLSFISLENLQDSVDITWLSEKDKHIKASEFLHMFKL